MCALGKEQAAPTWKKTFGFHPMTAWADYGAGGNGEPLAIVLRAGNAGSNTAADHIEAAGPSLAQLPRRLRRRALIRTDSGGGTHGFLTWLTAPSRRLRYSTGMTITEDMQAAIGKVPAAAWTPLTTATARSATEPGSRTRATDGGGGSGYADRLRPDSRPDLPFQDACSVSPSLAYPACLPEQAVLISHSGGNGTWPYTGGPRQVHPGSIRLRRQATGLPGHPARKPPRRLHKCPTTPVPPT